MENLPTDIRDAVLELDTAWKEYRSTDHMPRERSVVESQQNRIIAAKNSLINCLTEEVL